jgi:hypothetical protein
VSVDVTSEWYNEVETDAMIQWALSSTFVIKSAQPFRKTLKTITAPLSELEIVETHLLVTISSAWSSLDLNRSVAHV